MGAWSFDRYFCSYWEAHAVSFFTKSFDFRVASWLLSSEIITRKANDYQFILKLFVELLQLLVLWGEATLGCNVHHQ